MFRSMMLLLGLSLSPFALAQRPPTVVPARAEVVLERLPKGYAALTPTRAGAPATLAQVQGLLATAARTGDARLVARAEASLARFSGADHRADVIRARAYAAQYRHDFPAALALLDQLVQRDPRDADARLARAQIQLVQGRVDRARADCAALAVGVDAARGLLCVAAVSQRIGNSEVAARLLDRWLVQAGDDDETRRYALVMRAETASRAGQAEQARAWFRRALALAPDDVRTLAAWSRHLRAIGRNAEAFHVLSHAPGSDHLQLERALAAHAAHLPAAPALVEALARSYRQARAVGGEPDLRDEAEYRLTLRGDANGALALAQRNFDSQRDYEDVSLLRRAALAAHRPQALRPMAAWARSQALELPRLELSSLPGDAP